LSAPPTTYIYTLSLHDALPIYLKLLEAWEFYTIIALATLGGVALDFSPIDPIRALFWSAVVNGVIAVPIMVVMMLLADDAKVMGDRKSTRLNSSHRTISYAVFC